MGIMEGLVIIALAIMFVVLIAVLVRSDRAGTEVTPPRPTKPHPPATWSYTTVTPQCGSVKIVSDEYIKYCTRENGHDGEHSYKYIPLERGTDREDLS